MSHQEVFKNELKLLLSATFNKDQDMIDRFHQLIDNQPNDFWGKKSETAHMTASSLVVNDDLTEVLLTDHKKLKKWLQLGGHWCDFEDFPSHTVLDAAIKEVEEEGYGDTRVPQKVLLNGVPLDLDIHIAGDHTHYDVCFLSQVSKEVPICVSEESHNVKWVSIEYILENDTIFGKRLRRMCQVVKDVIR